MISFTLVVNIQLWCKTCTQVVLVSSSKWPPMGKWTIAPNVCTTVDFVKCSLISLGLYRISAWVQTRQFLQWHQMSRTFYSSQQLSASHTFVLCILFERHSSAFSFSYGIQLIQHLPCHFWLWHHRPLLWRLRLHPRSLHPHRLYHQSHRLRF